MNAIDFNESRAKIVLTKFYDAYEGRKGLYKYVRAETHAPQVIFHPKGVTVASRKHAVWLFFAALTDRRQVSMDVYRSHTELWSDHPYIYSPQIVGTFPGMLEELLIDKRIGVPNQSAGHWLVCARTLFNTFAGNPLQMYSGGSVASVMAFKKEHEKSSGHDPLSGFGPKITSLYAIFLELLGLIRIEDAFPVDVHVQRIFLSTNVITHENVVENVELERRIRDYICELCYQQNWSRVNLSHALWFNGNQLCNGCYRKPEVELLCAPFQECSGSVSTEGYFHRRMWDPADERFRKPSHRVFRLELVDTDSPQQPLFGT